MSSTHDLLSQILLEAQSYSHIADIEKLVESSQDLGMLPVQPLYLALKATSKEQVANILPKLSAEQRQALLDIDLWKKDEVDPAQANMWLEIYSHVPSDELRVEFAKGEEFLLLIKSQLTISTFDIDDPMYPDDDNYFLTEDTQLIIEYGDDFAYAAEVKGLIKGLYAELGVENAYAHLMKLVSDSYMELEEQSYQAKKERLRDFGMIDYYEALEVTASFSSKSFLDDFIKNKKGLTGDLEAENVNQALHITSLVAYQNGMEDIKKALMRIENQKRRDFLQFSFVRLVNARLVQEDAFKSGSLNMTKVGTKTKQCLELAYDYVLNDIGDSNISIFELFDFFDLYRIGNTLLELTKRKMKRAISGTPFEKEDFEYFLGSYWNAFLESSYGEVTKFKQDGSTKPQEINQATIFYSWNNAAEGFIQLVPYMLKFFFTLDGLKEKGLLQDEFYLNYEVDSIDFEAIILSSFINYAIGNLGQESGPKMGLALTEFKVFYHHFFTKRGEEYLIKGDEDPILSEKIKAFVESFGLSQVALFDRYLYQLMVEQLNGYEVDKMSNEDFKHVGGPILLNATDSVN